jgi:hypothetical protein
MKPADRTVRTFPWIGRAIGAALVFALALATPLVSGPIRKDPIAKDKAEKKAEMPTGADVKKPAKKRDRGEPPAGAVEVQFIDDSTMKLLLREERLELTTPYGKLLIPVGDIERIEVATRIPDDIAKRVAAAIADLGASDFRRREAASAELLELGERAYPALRKVAKSPDAEVVRRVRELLETIRQEVPEEHLEFRPHDVVYTEDSKFTGRIVSATLKVNTFQFGEQSLKLADVRGLRSLSAAEPEPANALPDPGNMTGYAGQVGQVYAFRITGPAQGGQGVGAMRAGGGGMVILGGGNVWGTDLYTIDSSLATAAVHAGVLKPGQSGVVRVKIQGPQQFFQGSTRHGVTSQGFGFFNSSFEFVRGRARPKR